MPAPQRKDLSHLSDEHWHRMLLRSVGGPVDGLQLPGFPSLELQSTSVGSANENALFEAFLFYQFIKQTTAELRAPLAPQSRILDFGIGWGRILRYFMKDVEQKGLFGVDVEQRMIDACRDTRVPASIASIDPRGSLPYRDSFFNLVYAYSVFTHLPEPVQNVWIPEIARVLRPGGVFVCTVEPLRFIDFVLSLSEPAEHPWHERLRQSVQRVQDPRGEFARRGFLFLPPPEAQGDVVYGNSVMSEEYIRRYWGVHLTVHQLLDDPKRFFQAVVVCQKRP